MPAAALQWQWMAWPDFDPDTLYAWLRLRSEIFVVEQNCVYADMDGVDPQCQHLLGRDAAGQVQAGLRGCALHYPGHAVFLCRPASSTRRRRSAGWLSPRRIAAAASVAR